MGGFLTLLYLALLSFVCGILIVFSQDEQSRRTGAYLIMIAIGLVVISLFVYSAGHYNL